MLVFAVAVSGGCSANVSEPVANTAAEQEPTAEIKNLRADIKNVEPFFTPMGEPQPNDWLKTFNEPGQTFDEYIDSNPTVPAGERRVIYIQPLGKFTKTQGDVIKTASGYIGAFFGLPVKSLPAKGLPSRLTEPDQRMIDYPQHRQIRTGYILEKILQPALPNDAAALIAFTAEDLYPDTSMYFVFGQASLENRVGVWSLFRLDDIGTREDFLMRTMKISAHEVGHMFSMRHCRKYECVMSGTNHIGETDRRPIDACPECMAKISWMMNEDPKVRYDRLAAFAKENKLTAAESDFKAKSKAVSVN